MPCPYGTIQGIGRESSNFIFAELVEDIISAKKLKKNELAELMGYDRKIFSRIGKGFIPPKKTVITLGVVVGLDIKQMCLFLFSAGYVLCPTITCDKCYAEVIEMFGGQGLKRLLACNEELQRKGLNKSYLLGSARVR